jgi:hypothetical protein
MSLIIESLKARGVDSVSPDGARVAVLLEAWVGLHHLSQNEIRRTDWSGDYVEIIVDQSMATFDGDLLTRLVFAAHDHGIRVEICGVGRRDAMCLVFHPRQHRQDGPMYARHPTLEEAVAGWRATNRVAP